MPLEHPAADQPDAPLHRGDQLQQPGDRAGIHPGRQRLQQLGRPPGPGDRPEGLPQGGASRRLLPDLSGSRRQRPGGILPDQLRGGPLPDGFDLARRLSTPHRQLVRRAPAGQRLGHRCPGGDRPGHAHDRDVRGLVLGRQRDLQAARYAKTGYDSIDNDGNGYVDDLPESGLSLADVQARMAGHTHKSARSEMLYALLVEGLSPLGSVFTADDFTAREVGDTDGDGLLEFIDAWGEPLQFYGGRSTTAPRAASWSGARRIRRRGASPTEDSRKPGRSTRSTPTNTSSPRAGGPPAATLPSRRRP